MAIRPTSSAFIMLLAWLQGPFTLEVGNVEYWRIECEKCPLWNFSAPEKRLNTSWEEDLGGVLGGPGQGSQLEEGADMGWKKALVQPFPTSLPLPRATSCPAAPCCVHQSLAPGDLVLYAGKDHPESASTSPVPSLSMEIKERDKWGPRRMRLASLLLPSP